MAREIISHRIDGDWRKDVRRVVDVDRLEEEIADAIRNAYREGERKLRLVK